MTYNFYDTSSLLLRAENLFDDSTENIIISSVTLTELENIKTSRNKSEEIKYKARLLTHLLEQNPDKYTCWIFNEQMLGEKFNGYGLTDDIKILASAFDYDNKCHPDETVFITNDLALKNIANLFFGSDSILSVQEEKDNYCGYKEIILNEEKMSEFYSNFFENKFNLLTNEYIILKDTAGQVVDTLRWTGEEYKTLRFGNFQSVHLGNIKPKKDDAYQAMAADSLLNNKITMLRGPAGSGKSLLSLSFLFSKLEQGKIDRIIVFCNTVATLNSARLGFYPGSKDEKLMDSQIGNMLASKLGGKIAVEQLIDEEKLALLPMSDLRGFDTSGMRAGIYITEAQNLDITLMKLALQRIGEDCICIIDGDDKSQVDDISYAGHNNGMKRVSKIFRGANFYGEITLNNIYRSQIAKLAENL